MAHISRNKFIEDPLVKIISNLIIDKSFLYFRFALRLISEDDVFIPPSIFQNLFHILANMSAINDV